VLITVAVPVSATNPIFLTIAVNDTFVSPSFTAACGFEVSITEVGILKAKVFADDAGSIVREIDTQPGFVTEFSSSESGKSFAYPFSTVFHFDYVNGTTPGVPVLVTATGLMDKVPGMSADAGRVTYGSATVLFVDPSGVPIVDFGEPTAINGRANDLGALVAAGCAALAP